MELKIKNVTLENLEDLVNLCIPQDRKKDPLFLKGVNEKKRWAAKTFQKYGAIAKIAYANSLPVGLIQYQPVTEEKTVKIDCIFVPEKENLRKGIGKALLKAVIEDADKPNPIFNGHSALALVTWAFQVPGRYPQHEFYQKMGFRRVREDDPFLLYYPFKKGYVYRPKEKKYTAQEEDKGKALIFYDPSCPFSIYFSEKIKELLKEITPNIQIRMINRFEEQEEVEKRGQAPACAVNGKPIQTFFLDKENFQKEVKQALES